jgi:hypothetical protein
VKHTTFDINGFYKSHYLIEGSGIARAIALAVGEAGGRVVAAAALAALTNGFLTGVSLPVDGGEHLV